MEMEFTAGIRTSVVVHLREEMYPDVPRTTQLKFVGAVNEAPSYQRLYPNVRVD